MENDKIAYFGFDNCREVTAEEFGNKASILTTMSALGIPVPPGFTLSVAVCEDYYNNNQTLPRYLPELLNNGMSFLQRASKKEFGSPRNPLLVSVRSGAPISMPGALVSLLNVGLNKDTLRGLIFQTGIPRFAWDSYRRFVQGFGEVVYGNPPKPYQKLTQEVLDREGVPDEAELDFLTLRQLSEDFDQVFEDMNHRTPPENVQEQLEQAVTAVLRSWASPRAERFRLMNRGASARGTAVTVQSMVYGNMGSGSGAGVAFTRNPWTGESRPVIDFKFGAQGEDVVSGRGVGTSYVELKDVAPSVYGDLISFGHRLEGHFKDMQDMEFTVQEGKLYILQSRDGKRSPLAALRIAVDLFQEGVITPHEGIALLRGVDLDNIMVEKVTSPAPSIAKGESASGGVAKGGIAILENLTDVPLGEEIILVADSISPDDLPFISASVGILTSGGTRTSHAVVVARQLGKICIVNCTDLKIDAISHSISLGGMRLREGDLLTLDGSSGEIYHSQVDIKRVRPSELLDVVEGWNEDKDTVEASRILNA